jgi:hypothetical protein
MRLLVGFALLFTLTASSAPAEVTRVSILSRSLIADGQEFGPAGAYEKLVGRIEFALDPAHPRNRAIVDLELAPRGTDKRVYFSADLFVLQPVDPAKGNGAMLFEVANRGRKGLLTWFNRARGAENPATAADMGDAFLLREGYTLVWIGWQFDVPGPLLTLAAPRADLKGKPDTVRVTFIVNAAVAETTIGDLPAYRPEEMRDPSATLSVRDRFWEPGTVVPRERWSFVRLGERLRLRLDPANPAGSSPAPAEGEGGFQPGRIYELSYPSTDAVVAGAGFAALRDTASAFRYRTDLPVRGRYAYAFGISQSGRFLRQFLAEGFNADERDRKVFDAVWPHIAGAGLGSFNERFAKPGYSSFPATRFPFTDAEQALPDGSRRGVLSSYTPEQQPKVFYTNSATEYWGQGRAAALTHTSLDGRSDLTLPANVRNYYLAGTQHVEGGLPPQAGNGQQPGNPMPQRQVMRALLRAMHRWVSADTPPPASAYPRLSDKSLVPVADVRFPAVPGVTDPRTIEGPGYATSGAVTPLPFLVPQVDADGNDIAGIRVPELTVPLATTTGWNFRSPRIGNPSSILALAGAYIRFPSTRAERTAQKDPRRSIEERYRGREDYLERIRDAADALARQGLLLAEDIEDVVERAGRNWDLK